MTTSKRLFGTDGVRGTAGVHPMTAEMALQLGQAVAHVFRGGRNLHRILIAKDTRLSGYMFEDALAAGICSMGVDVIQVGPLPTPALAFLTTDMRCDAGVMISASHNPYTDNGLKFFAHDGFKLPDEVERHIEALIQSGELGEHRADTEAIGHARRIEDAAGRYVVFLKNTVPLDLTLEGLHVVLDCANGAAYRVGPTVLEELGARVETIGVEPDGRNINAGCGSLHPEKLVARVKQSGADIGIAVDGDADRVLLVTEQGELVDGDTILSLCAEDRAERKQLRGGTVVATVMSNLGLEHRLAELGVALVRTQVGDRYVVEAMRQGGFVLGGEQSGHIVFLDHGTTGDGLLAALQVLSVMKRRERPLSELVAKTKLFPQAQVDLLVAHKRPLKELANFQRHLRKAEQSLGQRGRVLVRYSGTEPKARVMVEGEDEARVRTLASELADALRRALA